MVDCCLEMLVSLEQNDGSRALVQGTCSDNDVPHALDEKQILWAAGDIVENRPPLSRWHKDWEGKFREWVRRKSYH